MLKQISLITLGSIFMVSFNACSNNNKVKKTENGVEYKMLHDEKGGKAPAMGDIISAHMVVHLGDSILMDSRKINNNEPLEFPLMPPSFKGDWVEGLKLLTPGDSAEFYVLVDTIKAHSQGMLPEWMKSGDKIAYTVKMVSVKSQEEAKKEQEAQASKQNVIDDEKLQQYFKENNINPEKTASGVYYTIEKQGTGGEAARGQKVTVNYTGRTLEGQTFDSNTDPAFSHVQPFSFTLGRGEVISGWDDGISVLKKGSKATLYIPSSLAYGPANQPTIPANSVLIFNVEVVDLQNAQ